MSAVAGKKLTPERLKTVAEIQQKIDNLASEIEVLAEEEDGGRQPRGARAKPLEEIATAFRKSYDRIEELYS